MSTDSHVEPRVLQGTEIFQFCTCLAGRVTYNFHSSCKHNVMHLSFKDIDYCPIEIIKGLTDKGQFQYLTKLKGPQEGTYLYTTQFLSLR